MENVVDLHKEKEIINFEPFIFIDTQFVRKREMVLAMALTENQRRIRVSQNTIAAPIEAQIIIIGEMVRVHYKTSRGKLPIWGGVHDYKFFITPHKAMIFDVNGKYIETRKEELPDKASSSISEKVEIR